MKAASPPPHDVVIVGGGAGGIADAASLLRRRSSLNIAIVAPRESHYYQPGWTLVGCCSFDRGQTVRPVGLAWILKKNLMPAIYWDAMLKGHEWLAAPKLREAEAA